jgi:hypothetical protein
MAESAAEPTMLGEEEEEVLGEPSFQMWVRDGVPVVSGSYFMHPPLRARSAGWDPDVPGRLIVRASDGTLWAAQDVPLTGGVTAYLRPAGS